MNMRIPVGTAYVPTGNFCFRQFITSDYTCTGMLSNTQFSEGADTEVCVYAF